VASPGDATGGGSTGCQVAHSFLISVQDGDGVASNARPQDCSSRTMPPGFLASDITPRQDR